MTKYQEIAALLVAQKVQHLQSLKQELQKAC